MGTVKNMSRLTAVLAALGVIATATAGAASASTAMIPHPGPPDGGPGVAGAVSPSPVIHTVVIGGTPGWQIAVIAVAAALIAAVAAVLLDRARSSRRRLVSTPA